MEEEHMIYTRKDITWVNSKRSTDKSLILTEICSVQMVSNLPFKQMRINTFMLKWAQGGDKHMYVHI